MAFNISDFSSKVNQYGLSRDNLFILKITPPSLGDIMPAQDLVFFCRSVDLPSLNISTTDIAHQGWGKPEKMPTQLPFDNLQAIFMIDSGFRVKAFFHRWIQSVINYDGGNVGQAYNGMKPYQIAYKQDYVGAIEVNVFSFGDESIKYTYKFFDAFPTTMGNITTAWENNDSIMSVPITFSYSTYIVDGMGASSPYQGPPTEFASLGGISGQQLGSTIGQAVDSILFGGAISQTVNQFTTVANQFEDIFDIF